MSCGGGGGGETSASNDRVGVSAVKAPIFSTRTPLVHRSIPDSPSEEHKIHSSRRILSFPCLLLYLMTPYLLLESHSRSNDKLPANTNSCVFPHVTVHASYAVGSGVLD
jgi:hypothetical protein